MNRLVMCWLSLCLLAAACSGVAEDASRDLGSVAAEAILLDDDSASCTSLVRIGAGGPTVAAGQILGHSGGRGTILYCSDTFPSGRHSVDCPSTTRWLVVDRSDGTGGYDIRCYDSQPVPTPPPACPRGQKCCEPAGPGMCDLCVPTSAACP